MSDIVLKYPSWQERYRAAVLEANPTTVAKTYLDHDLRCLPKKAVAGS
jgi:hypothetical protein